MEKRIDCRVLNVMKKLQPGTLRWSHQGGTQFVKPEVTVWTAVRVTG